MARRKYITTKCVVCSKKFKTYTYKSKLSGLGDITVIGDTYCSRKCGRVMDDVIDNIMTWEREHPIQSYISWRMNDIKNFIYYGLFKRAAKIFQQLLVFLRIR